MPTTPQVGVSFVVPVYNGAHTLDAALRAILVEADDRPFEVIVVDDGSQDDSRTIAERHGATGRVRVLAGEGRGAAAAINLGLRHARYPVIGQIDQDVVLEPGWLRLVTAMLAANPDAAAVQGHYVAAPDADVWARVMGLDLRYRYARIPGDSTDHVCTGNSAYSAAALAAVGGLDATMGYGYDNDLSYRLKAAGYRLLLCRDARSIHRWSPGLRGYLSQQYGFGYGRLDVVAKHPTRHGGDRVSSRAMMLHAPAMLVAAVLLAASALLALGGGPAAPLAISAAAIVGLLALERLAAGARAARRFGDPTALLFPLAHLLRDLAWSWAILRWAARWARGRALHPTYSMRR